MLITNFASGELSPTLYGRVDLQQYYSGAAKLKNFEIIPTGGIKRRTGTKRVGTLHGDCKLIPFIINKDKNYIIEITTKSYTEEGVTSNLSAAYIWNTSTHTSTCIDKLPYTSITDIKEIQYAQNYDTIILVHQKYPPYELKYNGSTFEAGQINFNFYPSVMLDDDYDFIMVVTGNSLPTRTASINNQLSFMYDNTTKTYLPGVTKVYCVYKGSLYEWDDTVTNPKWKAILEFSLDEYLFKEENKYPSAVNFFNNRLWFAATFNEPQKVWASATPDTTDNRYNDFSTYQNYVTVSKQVKDPDAHIFTCDILDENVDKTNNVTTLVNVSQNLTNILQKNPTDYYVTGTHIPVGTKIDSIESTYIIIDKALDITEDYEGETLSIQLWKTYDVATADDYEFKVTYRSMTTSDCSFNFELASRENDAIKWLASNQYLTIGTESTVWCVGNQITALNIAVELAGHYGSAEMQAITVDRAVVFFAQGSMGIREQYYDQNTAGFMTNNIALHAEHLLRESAAIDFDYVNNPYNKLVIVRTDGIVVTLLYDKTNGILAWNRIEHGLGQLTIKNCAVVRGVNHNDIVYFSVKDGKDSQGNDLYYLERLDENFEVFLDSWSIYSGTALSGYSDNAYIYNKHRGILKKASEFNPATDYAALEPCYEGYLYESDIVSLPVIQNDPTGKKRIVNLIVRFMDSYLPKMKIAQLPDEEFIGTEEPFSGYKEITYPGISDRDVTFELKSNKPHAINILSVNATIA